MEIAETMPRWPRVLHGPHRLRASGIVAKPVAPVEIVPAKTATGVIEIVGEAVEPQVEIIIPSAPA